VGGTALDTAKAGPNLIEAVIEFRKQRFALDRFPWCVEFANDRAEDGQGGELLCETRLVELHFHGRNGDDDDVADAADGFEHHRLDVVGLDDDGAVVVTVEVERINHDTRRAVPEDYDKMAACEPEEAIWLAMSNTKAHEVLAALNDPLEGEPRVEKTYADSTPVSSFRIDEPGCTDIYTLAQLRSEILGPGEE